MAVPVAVGDWVVATSDRLEAVLARWSSLERQGPDSGKAQVLATNVDLVLVTVPADRPNARTNRRVLTLAWDSGARPVVVLTKTDLGDEGLAGELASRLVGADLVATSAETGAGVDQLATLLAPGRTAVLLGPSGAGKSTLTNALVGEHRRPRLPSAPKTVGAAHHQLSPVVRPRRWRGHHRHPRVAQSRADVRRGDR